MSLAPSPLDLATVAPCTPTFPMFFAWALGERGFTSVGWVSENFNNHQFQFVSIQERRMVGLRFLKIHQNQRTVGFQLF
jgi:hypothetical protein